jgi:hypothetical protein
METSMATLKPTPYKAPEPKPKPEAPKVISARVQALTHKQRHPVTGVMFNPGQPVDVIDLDSVDNAFVRHQLEAGVFQIV